MELESLGLAIGFDAIPIAELATTRSKIVDDGSTGCDKGLSGSAR